MVKVYLAGPMTGLPYFNFPTFDKAAEQLRSDGFEVVSPAELDSHEARAAAMKSPDGDPAHYDSNESWGDLLARDVKLIADEGIEAVFVLPGWVRSRGARLETFVARLCGVPIYDYDSRHEISATVLGYAHGTEKWVFADHLKKKRHPTVPDISPFIKVIETVGSEIRTVNTATGGEKGKKPEAYHLLPWEQLDEVARLYEFGCSKYAAHNWRKGFSWSLSFSSMMRHARSWWEGQEVDEETGCDHMASVVFHALALMFFKKYRPELDDRPPKSELSCHI